MKTVAVLVGSLRAASINRRFAEALAKLAEGRLAFRFVEIGDLPLAESRRAAYIPLREVGAGRRLANPVRSGRKQP